jgi:homoserine O-acetyltransferase
MMAHITYLSEEALHRKFGRRTRVPPPANAEQAESAALFSEVFEVESYLRHQGSSFVRRFDANSYLTVTRAMDWFDLAAEHDGDLSAAFAGTRTRFCLISFTSDWLFPTAQSRSVARALNRAAANVSFVEIETDRGHDAFLLDEPDFYRTLSGFLSARGRKHFFFEKKKQKTFASLGSLQPEKPQPKQSKVFCFFFSKKKAFLPCV